MNKTMVLLVFLSLPSQYSLREIDRTIWYRFGGSMVPACVTKQRVTLCALYRVCPTWFCLPSEHLGQQRIYRR